MKTSLVTILALTSMLTFAGTSKQMIEVAKSKTSLPTKESIEQERRGYDQVEPKLAKRKPLPTKETIEQEKANRFEEIIEGDMLVRGLRLRGGKVEFLDNDSLAKEKVPRLRGGKVELLSNDSLAKGKVPRLRGGKVEFNNSDLFARLIRIKKRSK